MQQNDMARGADGPRDRTGSVGAPVPRGRAESPTLARRFGALLIDWLLCLLASNLLGDPVQQGWPPVVVLIAEYALFVGLFTQTPGMWFTRIRCVGLGDFGRIGVVRAALRAALLCLVVSVLLMDDRRRGLHDRLVGSVLIPVVPEATAS